MRIATKRYQITNPKYNQNAKKGAASVSKQPHQAMHPDDSDMQEPTTEPQRVTRAIAGLNQGLTPLPRLRPWPASHPIAPSSYQSPSPSKPSGRTSPTKIFRSGGSISPTKSITKSLASSSISNIDSRDQLPQLSPSISIHKTDHLKKDFIPQPVVALWKEYIQPATEDPGIVPEEQKDFLEKRFHTPMKTKRQIPLYSYAQGLYDPQEMSLVMDTIQDVVEGATDQSHGCEWTNTVVAPLFERLCKLITFRTTGGDARLKHLSMTSVEISPKTLCPASNNGPIMVAQKKIDHGLTVILPKHGLGILGRRKYQVSPLWPSINQTKGSTALKLMCLYVAIKMDAGDPLLNLGPFIAAEFTKRWKEGWQDLMHLPAIAIAVDQHHWTLWIACAVDSPKRTEDDSPFSVHLIGPTNIGNSTSIVDTFRILHVLKAVARWALDVHEPAFRQCVLAPKQ
ncbi:MAG: hypothetical protein Q9224_004972 [Gallowayella concinna]